MARTKKVVAKLNGKEQEALKVDKSGTLLFMPDSDLDEVLYSAYAQKFQTGKTDCNTWLSSFVSNNLDAIQRNIKLDPATSLSAIREINKAVKDTQDYYNSKKETDTDFSKYLLRTELFEWQKKVYDSNSKKKTMLCGRRSGKSFVVCHLALKHCIENPPVINGIKKPRKAIIMGLTLEKTAAIYWENLKEAIKKSHINTAKIDNGSYTVYFPNGNELSLSGNNSKAEREKLRGKDLSFAAIDESQSQQGLFYLINDVINPMLKGTAGELVLLGTAPLYAGTPWEAAILSDTYEHFHATMEDNPSIPDHQHALEQVLIENKWTKDNITFRREYLGEIAYDTNRLIYGRRKYYNSIPKDFKPVCCYIGADYGWSDNSAFMPIIIDANGQGYLVDEFKANHVPASQLVERMNILTEKIHKEWDIPVSDITIVQDTSHQMIGQDFNNEGKFNLVNAYKLEQNAQIARVAEALEIGDLLVKEEGFFDLECDQFVWQYNEEKGQVIYKIDDDAFHGDAVDAVQYAWSTYIADRNLARN